MAAQRSALRLARRIAVRPHDAVGDDTSGSGLLIGIALLAAAADSGWWFLLGRRRRDDEEEELALRS